MEAGSIVQCVVSFDELRRIWKYDYPEVGDFLTVSMISEHPNTQIRLSGIVLLHFIGRSDLPGICDRDVNGRQNFIEIAPPLKRRSKHLKNQYHNKNIFQPTTLRMENQTGHIGADLTKKLFDSSVVVGASESLGQKTPIEPRVIRQLDNWRYEVPLFRVTDTGIEYAGSTVIELCRGNKSDPEAPRQTGLFTETLLEVCCQYLTSVNKGDLANRDTSIAITDIENALLRLGKRAEDRRLRGVQGSYSK